MYCPRCFNNVYTKSGSAKCKPRYKCKSCDYRYTVEYKSTSKPSETRRLALGISRSKQEIFYFQPFLL